MTTTSRGLPIPTIDLTAARSAALRIRQAGTAAHQCLRHLHDATPAGWTGQTNQAYLDDRALVSRRATDLAQACLVLDQAVVQFSQETGTVLPRWRPAAERLEHLELACTDPATAGLAATTPGRLETLLRERDDLRVEVAALERQYDDATSQLSHACHQAIAIIDDGHLSTTDQLSAIPRTVVQQTIVEPLDLAALLIDDPTQADEIATTAWHGLIHQVRHLDRTAADLAGVPAYQDGRWGKGVGTGIATIAGAWGGRRFLIPETGAGGPVRRQFAGSDARGRVAVQHGNTRKVALRLTTEELVRFGRNLQVPGVSRPKPQTLDEMRAGVDLSRSEHIELGHTLSRHVDVDTEYLAFRLQHGTPQNDGTLGIAPREASGWRDVETAEATITTAINAPHNSAAIQALADGQVARAEIWMRGNDLGVSAQLSPHGTPNYAIAEWATIVLRRDGDALYVQTAHVSREIPPNALAAGVRP